MNNIPKVPLGERLKRMPSPRPIYHFYALFPDDLCNALDEIYHDGFFLRVLEDRILPRAPNGLPCLTVFLAELPLEKMDKDTIDLIYMILIEPFVHNKQGVLS